MHGHNYDYARRLCRKVVNDMHFIFSYGFGVINLPREAVLRALPTLGGDCAKVLLALAANADLRIDTETKYEAIAAAAGVSLAAAQDAVGSLAEQGLLVPAVLQQPEKEAPQLSPVSPQAPSPVQKTAQPLPGRPRKNRIPAYSNEEIAHILTSDAEASPMIELAQTVVGKVFSEHEVASLVALHDYFGFDAHYILSLLAYLAKKNKANMRYIEATAAGLYDNGITTVGALQERFAFLDRTEQTEQKLRRLLGLGERALTAKEKKTVEELTSWDISDELLQFAYEQTVAHTTRPTLNYMAKVLRRAHEDGITTAAQAQEKEAAFRAARDKNGASAQQKHSFESSAFLDAALARSYGVKLPQNEAQPQQQDKVN